jgi:membrane fusion protein (multidrug efflux system)
VIPPPALISTPAGFVVYIINENKTVEVRPVNAELSEGKVIVHSGLKEGEIVIAEGIIKARPGQPVNTVLKSGEQKPNSERK